MNNYDLLMEIIQASELELIKILMTLKLLTNEF